MIPISGIPAMLLVLAVGISAITTASVALSGVNLCIRDRGALWMTTTTLALILLAVFIRTLTNDSEPRYPS